MVSESRRRDIALHHQLHVGVVLGTKTRSKSCILSICRGVQSAILPCPSWVLRACPVIGAQDVQ